ncbi:MAG: hypothetical protein ACOX7F_02605 [Eubacteriales bacterium]
MLLAGISMLMLHMRPGVADIIVWGMISMIAAAAVCGFMYAGLHLAAGASVLGIISGLAYMVYVFCQPVEWRGLVGLVSGVQVAFICFLIGINAQMILYVVKKRGGKKGYGKIGR